MTKAVLYLVDRVAPVGLVVMVIGSIVCALTTYRTLMDIGIGIVLGCIAAIVIAWWCELVESSLWKTTDK